MTRMRVTTAALILGAIILVGFVLSVPHTRDVPTEKTAVAEAATPAITVHDVFKKGTHTISGSITLPTRCSNVTVTSSVQGEGSQSILLAFDIPEDTGVCLELPTNTTYSTSVAAPADLPIVATVNGKTASTTPK